jgi:hypothetical protein
MAVGIASLTVGVVLGATGGPLLANGKQTCTNNGQGFDCTTTGRTAAIGLLIAGAATVVLGIPLIAYGARYEEPDDAAQGRRPAFRKWAGAPTTDGWAWAF